MSDSPSFPEVESSLHAGLARLSAGAPDPEVDLDERDEGARAARARLAELAGGRRTRYVLQSELGRGGMGVVYKVLDADLRRSLAMKVLSRSEHDVHPALLARFLEEAQVTGQLDHPSIVPLHEVGIDANGRVYFTMRLVRGKHMGDVIERARANADGWSVERAVDALTRVCEAMAYAHDKGVVHRDLKPQNVMAGRFGEVYVMDWGLAKVRGRPERSRETTDSISLSALHTPSTSGKESSTLTIAGSVFGTPAYMAPEQARGAMDEVDGRADVYSVGAILYELLCGDPPYLPDDARLPATTVLQCLLDGAPRPLARAAPDAPAELVAICERAMRRDPNERYPDMQSLAADLRAWLAGRPVSALPLSAGARVLRWGRRYPWAAAALLAVTLGGATGVWRLTALGTDLLHGAARDDAASKARMLETVNALYSAEVAGRVDKEHVAVTHDWAEKAGAIPLPATFLTELAHRVSSDAGGAETIKHYSDHPFRFRGEPSLDAFGARALAELRADPDRSVESFEEVDGRPVLRYAVARRMGESCVACHNAHPDSTKRNWKVGDVRGVLEIDRPLDQDVRRTRSGLKGALAGVATLMVLLAGACAFALVRGSRGESRRP